MEKNYKIYVLQEPDGVTIRYVGYTGMTLDVRKKYHIRHAKKGGKYHRANWIRSLLKNGQEPIIKLIEDNLKFEETLNAEINYIKKFKKLGYDLTNNTNGGEGCVGYKHTDEFKKKLSLRMTGKNHPMYGKPGAMLGKNLSAEAKKKLSIINTGENNPMYGKSPSTETKEKMKRAATGRILSEETKNKIREKATGRIITEDSKNKMSINSPKCRPIIQYDMNMNILNEFYSIGFAARALNLHVENIYSTCRGKSKSCGGFIWKYQNKLSIDV